MFEEDSEHVSIKTIAYNQFEYRKKVNWMKIGST